MKKTFLSLICLFAIAATGFSQQNGNRLTVSQNKPLTGDEVSVNFGMDCRVEINWFCQKEPVCNLFKKDNASPPVDYTLLCIPNQLFFDKIINQLFINQY